MSASYEEWHSLDDEKARFPLNEVIVQLKRGEATVKDVGMEGFAYLIRQVSISHSELTHRPLIAVTPTEEEAIRLGHNLRACLAGGGPLIGDVRRSVYVWSEPSSPYESIRASRKAAGERLAMLSMIAQGRGASIQVMSVMTYARQVISAHHLRGRTQRLVVGKEIDRDALIESLASEGYERVSLVHEPCSFLVRGDRLDIFSPHLSAPVRVSFFGDEIESICTFRIETQRRDNGVLNELTLPPLREAPLTAEYASQCGDGVVGLADELWDQDPTLGEYGIEASAPKVIELADALTDQIAVAELEALLPCFFPEGLSPISSFITEGISPPWFVVWDRARVFSLLEDRLQQWEQVHKKGLQAGHLSAPPKQHLLEIDRLEETWREQPCLIAAPYDLADHSISLYLPSHLPLRQRLDRERGSGQSLGPLTEAIEVWLESGKRIALVCQTRSQRDRLSREFGQKVSIYPYSLSNWLLHCQDPTDELIPNVYIIRGMLGAGFHDQEARITLISAAEIFSTPLSMRRQTKGEKGVDLQVDALLSGMSLGQRSDLIDLKHSSNELGDPWDNQSVEGMTLDSVSEELIEESLESPFIRSLTDLNVDDPIVHLDYGIGIFKGLVQIEDQGSLIDFAHLVFAKKEAVLLPVYRLHLIQKFIGTRNPKLSVKGSDSWKKSVSEAKQSAEDQARKLLEVYAERARTQGFAYSEPDQTYAEFEARFPYTETRDQLRAIRKIIAEMCLAIPMDHLLCGDVGFGKTEVAMRAAMKAVLDGKQVVVLVPTTILASQHTKSFNDRFAYAHFRIAQLSRFITPEKQREVKDGLRRGDIDIVIGTHSVLQKSVEIPRLGLLILDEEHRFGVKDKERFKELRANLDVLSMTATPIPRTLHMSLSGLRSMSVIATPPRDRLSVHTRMVRMNDAIVREAVLNELRRGGQVFFVHNRVESIETRRRWLSSIVPESSIGVAHGKMKPRDLEEVMWSFTDGAFNVLLCTTLVENGIDIPRANTIIIDNADIFGLSQLYQLRGRVGRSHERGKCILLISPEATLSDEARARLSAIQKFTELGSGFHIASQDLELRGAGELLGTRQKGHAQKVGLELYGKLLEQAMSDLNERPLIQEFEPHIKLSKKPKGTIPIEYIDDVQERLRIYRRISHFKYQEQIPMLYEELIDRFGPPPQSMLTFLNLQRVVLLAKAIGVFEIFVEKYELFITLHVETRLTESMIAAVLNLPDSPFTKVAGDRLYFTLTTDQRRQIEQATAQALLYFYDRLPKQSVL
jgi:transcription-repair coupling factor (superfamily II helicase)